MPSGWSVLIAGVHVALTHRRLVMLACIGWEDTHGSSAARSLHLPRHGMHGCHSLPKPTHDKAPLAQSWRRCPARYLHGTSHRCAALNSARLAKQDPPAPSIVAPLCTASSTARSKPDRSLCIRLPAAVFKESSAQGGQGSWRMMRAARAGTPSALGSSSSWPQGSIASVPRASNLATWLWQQRRRHGPAR